MSAKRWAIEIETSGGRWSEEDTFSSAKDAKKACRNLYAAINCTVRVRRTDKENHCLILYRYEDFDV